VDRRCIFCGSKKPEGEFNREHVIPQAFGTFQRGLVLDCVCIECNDYFGATIDLELARDSIEGIDRFWSGLKSPAEFKSLGKRSTTSVQFKPGAIHGGSGYAVANTDGSDLRVIPFPQIGFRQEPLLTIWFRADELPDRANLGAHGIATSKPYEIHVREMSTDHAREVLLAKGYSSITAFDTLNPPTEETIETFMTGVIGRPERRAATKLALEYLAAVAGPALVRDASFDAVREFARFDTGESRVHISENPIGFVRNGKTARGHYLAVHTDARGFLIAQVSLMLRIRYVVHLMTVRFLTATPCVASAHFFDLETQVATAIQVPRLVPGRQLKRADGE
jgi:hypothetical protein